jgi:hypothetical protein
MESNLAKIEADKRLYVSLNIEERVDVFMF